MHILTRDDDDALNCGSGGGADTFFGLRVASIFIISLCSTFGALFPVLVKSSSWLHVPKSVFESVFLVINLNDLLLIACAASRNILEAVSLSQPLLSICYHPLLMPYRQTVSQTDGGFMSPYTLGLCMFSIVFIFILELIAFRWGTKKLAQIGMRHDAHGHQAGSYTAHGPEGDLAHQTEGNVDESKLNIINSKLDIEDQRHRALDSAMTQIIGVAILEFGVNLHSVFVGLTLAVDPDFRILFVVLIFHQTFEGLAVGSRLAYLDLPPKYRWTPYAGAALYGLTTPVGIAAGLGVRTTYNPGSTTASIVSGTLDAFSSGILIYTGLVELLAHEFLFNKEMMTASNGKLAYAIGCMLAGCGIMSLLGRWA
ncbi:Zip-domain-containing protein [Armillaria gallica]|uniref:Zip-domain-containing protein n=1 Tax=Armillaria gallica TaxID=47427 RepID=A0A2H3EEJ3_ARMGA|nr:Zip-domain-containing protein [Armillaria gallica]